MLIPSMARFNPYLYDAFISHAVEDKIAIANDLSERLTTAGVVVWYSGNELNAGGDLHKTIVEGLNQSRFGVAILSPTYLAKNYTKKEYFYLRPREANGQGVILSVLHDITAAEVLAFDPEMGEKFMIDSKRGMDYVVKELLKVILPDKRRRQRRAQIFKALLASAMVAFALLVGYAAFWYHTHRPTRSDVEKAIVARISALQRSVEDKHLAGMRSAGSTVTHGLILDSVRTKYESVESRYRNEYEFMNDFILVTSRRRVWDTLKVDPETLMRAPQCGFANAEIYFLSTGFTTPAEAGFGLINKDDVNYHYEWRSGSLSNVYTVTVAYTNPIRFVQLRLLFPARDGIKRRRLTIHGLLPVEHYEFAQSDEGSWTLARVY